MQKQEQIFEEEGRTLYRTEDPEVLIISYKDELTSRGGEKKALIKGRALINNRISAHIFRLLEKNGVRTYFIEETASNESAVRKLDPIPLIVRLRNYASKDLEERIGIEEGRRFASPILEFSYENAEKGHPLINGYYVLAMGLASREEIDKMAAYAFRINQVLETFFAEKNIDLIDFKIRFGRDKDQALVLMGELTPDTCRLWDKETHEKLDKDRFRRDLGNVEDAYREVYKRIRPDGEDGE